LSELQISPKIPAIISFCDFGLKNMEAGRKMLSLFFLYPVCHPAELFARGKLRSRRFFSVLMAEKFDSRR